LAGGVLALLRWGAKESAKNSMVSRGFPRVRSYGATPHDARRHRTGALGVAWTPALVILGCT